MIQKYLVIIKGVRITSDTESVLLHSFFLKSFLNDQNCQQSKLGQTFQLDATNSLHWCRPVQSKYKGLMLDKRTLPYSKGGEISSLILNANSLLLDYSPIISPLTECLRTFGLDVGGIGGRKLVKIIPNLIHRGS